MTLLAGVDRGSSRSKPWYSFFARVTMLPGETKNVFNRLDGETHVWWVRLDQASDVVEYYRGILGERARGRIERFKASQLRDRHTVASGSLISLIAHYTQEAPRRIELEYNKFQKPLLVNHKRPTLQFSASHSNQIGMYGFTQDKLVGVDVEEIPAAADWRDIGDTCLSDFEKVWFSRLPSARRIATLIQIWTIKEAYLKAIGTGLSVPPASVELEFTEADRYQFHRTPHEEGRGGRWNIFTFSPVPGFLAAVVVEGGSIELRRFCWEPEWLVLRTP